MRQRLNHGLAFPAAAAPAPDVGERTVEFVSGHAEPKSRQPEPQCKREYERGDKPERPHHSASDNGGELGIARGAQRGGDDEVYCLEGLHGYVAPETNFSEAEYFGIVGVEPEQMFAQKRYDNREQEPARDADGKRLAHAAVRLVEIVRTDQMRHENLVSAAEADSEDY